MPGNVSVVSDKLQQKIAQAKAGYPALWKKVTAEWGAEIKYDRAWLTYAANYLLHTAGVHWALDPYSFSSRVDGIPQPNYAHDLQQAELIVLTHAHKDHLDMELIRAVCHLPIQWVIPEPMQSLVFQKTPLKRDQVITPVNGVPITINGLTLTPFDSLHYHELGGIAETGYLAEFDGKRWLFPADVRDFTVKKLPTFASLDGIFAHLWLGKAKALAKHPPYLESFCDFFTTLAPSKLVIAHLNEFGRPENELWNESHFALVAEKIKTRNPNVDIQMALMGMNIPL